MKTQVRWPARELLVHNAFNEHQFIVNYALRGGVIVSPLECRSCDPQTLGQGCHLPGESYPDFVLCLVDLLRAQGLQYLVLYDANGGSNSNILDSFVYRGILYLPNGWNARAWFATLPDELQRIFTETAVIVELEEGEA